MRKPCANYLVLFSSAKWKRGDRLFIGPLSAIVYRLGTPQTQSPRLSRSRPCRFIGSPKPKRASVVPLQVFANATTFAPPRFESRVRLYYICAVTPRLRSRSSQSSPPCERDNTEPRSSVVYLFTRILRSSVCTMHFALSPRSFYSADVFTDGRNEEVPGKKTNWHLYSLWHAFDNVFFLVFLPTLSINAVCSSSLE